jgi:hypothetical protein
LVLTVLKGSNPPNTMEFATTSHHLSTNQTQATIPSPTNDIASSTQLDSSAVPAKSDQGHEEEDGVEAQALVLTDDGASPDANEGALTSRLSYDTGHGDFCFSRLVYWEKKKFDPTNEEERLWCTGITGSNGVPVVELGGFQRYSPPYFLIDGSY